MATLTLRPNAAGDETNWTPNTGDNYAAVDETSSDSDTTYVERNNTTIANDLYNIGTDALLTGATINSVTVYVMAKSIDTQQEPACPLYVGVKSGSTTDWKTASSDINAVYNSYNQAWTTNPADSAAWEKADIDALQIGIRGQKMTAGARSSYPRVTQLYAVVDYTEGASATNVVRMML